MPHHYGCGFTGVRVEHHKPKFGQRRDGLGLQYPESVLHHALVKLRVNDLVQHTASEGDGPVNALDGALRKALVPAYPRLNELHLVDYKVRVVNPKEGTAAKVRVVIESRDGTDVWGTVGVSENVVEASWLALADSIEYKLFKDDESRN